MAAAKGPSPSLAFVPGEPGESGIAALTSAAKSCTACHLYKNATQTVFGEGAAHARLVLVGEQPGDQEDQQGHPFVGPAGRILDAALEEAGIAKDDVYVTNAVKHFKWEPRGKRRLHAKPNTMEVHACHGWLEAELAAVRPQVVVCLGATAAQAVLGKAPPIKASRGKVFESPYGAKVIITSHPSAILRVRQFDEAAYEEGKRALARDLAQAMKLVTGARSSSAPTSRSEERSARPVPSTRPPRRGPATRARSTRTPRAAGPRRGHRAP
jgi:DNA polymerase